MAAVGVFRGAGLVCVAVNDEMRELAGDIVGYPAREAFVTDAASCGLRTMELVFADGVLRRRIIRSRGVLAVVTIAPVYRQGQLWGVASHWHPVLLPRGTHRSPELRPGIEAGRAD